MGQVAADGAAIADLRMRNMRQRLVHERQVARCGRIALKLPIPGQRTDPQSSRWRALHTRAHRQWINVDQYLRLGESEIERRNKTLAARQEASVLAIFGFERQSLLQRTGCYVFKWRGLHGENTRPIRESVATKYGKLSPDKSKCSQKLCAQKASNR